MSLEERVARLEGIMEQINVRLNHIEARLNHIENDLKSNFRWTIGIIITMWVTIIISIALK
jgi:archaellum component FlaC